MSLRELATGSAAARWTLCSGSVGLGKNLTEPPRPWAAEGTHAHELAAQAISDNTPLDEIPDVHLKTYVGFIRETSKGPYHVEERLSLLGSSGGIDCYALEGKTAYLWDLKWGLGKRVVAADNLQLAFYATALKEKYPQITVVYAYIIQPRVAGVFEDVPSITSCTFPWQTLLAFRRKFSDALDEVEKGSRFQSGEHCSFCLCKPICPAFLAYADSVVEETEDVTVPVVDNLPVPSIDNLPVASIPLIARILLAETRLKGWFARANEFLLQQALAGVEIPGWELKQKRSYRKWISILPEEELAETLRQRGIADPYEHSLIPITRAERLIDISGLTEKPEGAPTLKPRK